MIILKTGRVLLRTFAETDFNALYSILSDGEVMRFIGNQKPKNKKLARAELTYWIEHQNRFGFSQWAIIENNNLIGRAGLNHLDGSEKIELGYLLQKPAWGRGLATEIARALVEYANDNQIKPIVAVTHPENTASQQVLQKAGLKAAGVAFFYGKKCSYFEL